MLDLDPRTGLPSRLGLAERLGHPLDALLVRKASDALVTPAATLAERPSKQLRGHLVALGRDLAGGGGDERQLRLCTQAVELLHAGSLIVDDIQDGSATRRGGAAIHRLYGTPAALCAGNWLYFWPLRLVRELALAPETERRAYTLYHDAIEHAHYGQALDLSVHVEQVPLADRASLALQIAGLKSGALTSLAMSLGALLSDADAATLAAIERFGSAFGTTLQVLDDLGNLLGRADPAKCREDLAQRKVTCIWSLAEALGLAAELESAVQDYPARDGAAVDAWLAQGGVVARSRALLSNQLDAAARALQSELGRASDDAPFANLRKLFEVLLDVYIS